MKFKTEDSVRVKPGVKIPDIHLELEGWQGRISEVTEHDTVCVDLDSHTLLSLPDTEIKKCEQEGVGWHQVYFGLDDLELVAPRDTKKEVDKVLEKLFDKFGWCHLGEQGDRIHEVLSGISSADEGAAYGKWFDHIMKNLTLPCEAEIMHIEGHGALNCGDDVTVISINEDIDLNIGILAVIKKDNEIYYFPLSDIEVKDEDSKAYTLISDYAAWCTNR